MPEGYRAGWEVHDRPAAEGGSAVEFVVRIEGEEPRVLRTYPADDVVEAAAAVRIARAPIRD